MVLMEKKMIKKGLKKVTLNLGEVIEQENYIVCNVNNKKLQELYERGIVDLNNKEIKEKYNITKNVMFNIKDFNFNEGIFLSTNESVTFTNCTFIDDIYIGVANNVIFDDNNYINTENQYRYAKNYMVIDNINSVTFINDNITNNIDKNMDLLIEANKIRFINTTISDDYKSNIKINGERINFINSKLLGKESRLNAQTIVIDDDSKLLPIKSIITDSKNNINSHNIDSNKIIINGVKKDKKRTRVYVR